MYRIMIVDDEQMVIESIRGKINFQKLCAEFVGSALNGRDALEKLDTLRPQIIIVDIRMPIVDGLAFIQKMTALKYPAKIIISTAHSDFAYAKKAIQLGVVDYLIKPIKKSELNHSLNAGTEQLKKDNQGKELAIVQLMHPSPVQRKTAASHLNSLYFFKKCKHFQIILVEMFERKTQDLFESTTNSILYHLKEVLAGMKIICDMWVTEVIELAEFPQQYIILLGFEEANPDLTLLCGLIEKRSVQRYICHCIVSETKTSLVGLQEELPRLQSLLLNRILKTSNVEYNDALDYMETFKKEELRNLSYFVRNGNLKNTSNEIRRLINDFQKKNKLTQRSILWICNVILGTVYNEASKNYPLPATLIDLIRLLGLEPEAFEDIDRVFEDMELHVESIISDISTNKYDNLQKQLCDAKEYIDLNYAQEIKLRDLAQRLFYSEEYFSKLFKLQFKESFMEYLTRVRMENAEKLIEESAIKLSDVALLSGYNDYKYFCRQFKQRYGVAPSEMRRMMSSMEV